MKRHRLINFRSFCITAVFGALSVLCALISCNLIYLGGALFIGLSGLIIFLLVAAYKNAVKRFTYIFTLAVFISSFAGFFGYKSYWRTPSIDFTQNVTVEGVVNELRDEDGVFTLLADELTVEGERVHGKIELYVYDGIYLSPGDKISLQAVITPIELIDGFRVNSSVAVKGVKYTAKAFSDEVEIIWGSPGVRQRFLGFIRAKLLVMGENAELAYSMLTGDRGNLDSSLTNSFSLSGISHILAVSGLHVGFISAILAYVLKKLRINRRLNLFISCTALLAYAWFISSVTVLRAVIMCCVGLFTYLNGCKRDVLNSLGIAVTLILLIMPFQLFDLGFTMSICAVGGIALLSGGINRIFSKIKLPCGKILSASLSAQIGVLPCMVYYFGYIQPFSLIFNIVLVPIISVAFQLTTVLLLISVVIPPLNVLLKFPSLIFGFINLLSNLAYELPFNKIIFFAGSGIFIFYVWLFIAAGFVRDSWVRTVAFTLSLTLLITVNLYQPVKMAGKAYMIPINDNYRLATVVKGKSSFYVGEPVSAFSLKDYVREYSLSNIEEFYLFDIAHDDIKRLVRLRVAYDKFDVYAPHHPKFEQFKVELLGYGIKLYAAEEGRLSPYYLDGRFVGYSYEDILFLNTETSYTAIMSNRFKFIRCIEYSGRVASALFVNGAAMGEYVYGAGYVLDLKTHKVIRGRV